MLTTLDDVVARYWGYTTFRPLQREAMDAVLAGRDSIVVLPTGGGKSLCFQAPALVRDGLAVVVSPLISLMKDQVDTLVGNGVPAALYQQLARAGRESGGHRGAAAAALSAALRLARAAGRRRRRRLPVDARVVRRQLRRRGRSALHQPVGARFPARIPAARAAARSCCPGVSLHAYTATATARVRRDIAAQLALNDPLELVGSFDRPNLVYRVLPRATLKKQLRRDARAASRAKRASSTARRGGKSTRSPTG